MIPLIIHTLTVNSGKQLRYVGEGERAQWGREGEGRKGEEEEEGGGKMYSIELFEHANVID